MSQLTEREQKDLDLQKQPNNKVDVYFVRHAESCSNAISMTSSIGYSKVSHPPLSYKGIQEAINLGINNEIIDKDFDKYYCSPSLRTIMTACLALRSKSRKKKITLILNPYLIEIKNTASIFDQEDPADGQVEIYDRQNAFVPKQNLMNMINYIKLWFDNKYIDNYIDYEFVYLMYDLVFLLYFQKKLIQDLYTHIQKLLHKNEKNRKQLLKQFISLIQTTIDAETYSKCINRIDFLNKDKKNFDQYNIYKNILFFIDNLIFSSEHTPAVLKNIKIIIYQEQNTEKTSIKKIIDQLILLTQDNFFMNNIEIDYSYKDNQIHNAEIKNFISNEIFPLKEEKKNYNILCFTHGATLVNRFTLKPKLNNTEIIRYDANNDNNERIFNNNIIIDEELLKDIDICGDIKPQRMQKLLQKFASIEYKMFKVIDNYFQIPEYKITTDNDIIEDFKVDILNEAVGIADRAAKAKAIEAEILKKEVESAIKVLKDITAKAIEAREEFDRTKAAHDEAVKYSLGFNKTIAMSFTASAEKDLLAAEEKAGILEKEEEAAFIAYKALVENAQKADYAAKIATDIAANKEQEAKDFAADKAKAEEYGFELVSKEQYKNKYLKYKQKYFNLKKNKQLNS